MIFEHISKEITPVMDESTCDGHQISSEEQGDSNGRTSKEYIEIRAIKKLYDAIIQRKIISVLAIQWLEHITGYDFKCTRDFHDKMGKFFGKHYYLGADLRRARKWSGLERSDLADLLGVSVHTIKKMEINKKPLSQDAIDFIIAMGFKKTIPLKKKKKKASATNRIQTRKNDKIAPEKKLQNAQVSDTIECEVCNRRKDSWEVTIDCINSYRTQFICEDCLSNSKKRKKGILREQEKESSK